MESGKNFSLQYYNGSSYSTVSTFVSGSDFTNNVTYNVTINLTGTFSSQARFRFINQGTDNSDYIFIDAVVLTGFTGSSMPEYIRLIDVVDHNPGEYSETFLHVFPNPVHDEIQYEVEEGPVRLKLYDATGKLMQSFENRNSYGKLPVSDLPAGVYILIAETPHDVHHERFIKE